MNETEFWKLIELAGRSAGKATAVPAWLEHHIAAQGIDSICAYEVAFRRVLALSYDARLWAAAGLMLKFCSDDKFMDFRAWLVAKGRIVFERAVADPDSLAEVDVDGDYGLPILFNMNYAAEMAYRTRAGPVADLSDLIGFGPPLVLLNGHAWTGDLKALPGRFPKLWAKFGKTAPA